MKTPIRHMWDLSVALAKAEFKERNEGSYLGIFWYLLNPLLLFLLLLLVFGDRVGGDIRHYPLYLLLGIIIFNFFQRSTLDAAGVIREHRWLIKSIRFPRGTLINAVVLKTFFSHVFEIALFVLFLFIFRHPFHNIIFYPIIAVPFYLFTLGTSLILSSLAVYLIDIEHVWTFVSRLIWLGTPIFYDIGEQTRLAYVSLLNPMYYFITISRDIIVYSKMPQLWMVCGLLVYSILFAACGFFIFSRLKGRFAEML